MNRRFYVPQRDSRLALNTSVFSFTYCSQGDQVEIQIPLCPLDILFLDNFGDVLDSKAECELEPGFSTQHGGERPAIETHLQKGLLLRLAAIKGSFTSSIEFDYV